MPPKKNPPKRKETARKLPGGSLQTTFSVDLGEWQYLISYFSDLGVSFRSTSYIILKISKKKVLTVSFSSYCSYSCSSCSTCYSSCSACYSLCSACYSSCSACYFLCSACYSSCSC